jgi:hypothetical protein
LTSIFRQKYQDWIEKQRKKRGGTRPTSGEISQLTEDNKCTFCGALATNVFSQREMMIVFITSIKSNPMTGLTGAEYLGFLIGFLRQKFCPDVSVNECQQIIHSVTHLKDKALDHIVESNKIWENIGQAKLKLCITDEKGFLVDNANCKCECHKKDMPFCDNCSSNDVNAKNGVWHCGSEEKELLFEFAKSMGGKI